METEGVRLKMAFVYAGGRECRLMEARSGNIPADFFYGALELEQKGYAVEVYDLDSHMPGILGGLCNRVFRSWFPPKTTMQDIVAARRLLPQLRSVDVIVATASGCAFALGFWKKLRYLQPKLVGIHCGIVNYQHDRARRRSAATLLKTMDSVLFASNEMEEMRRQFCADALFPAWFGVDEKFWSPSEEDLPRAGVLAVGNDSRRDYKTFIAAAMLLPEISFRIITRRGMPNHLPSNVEIIRGDWKSDLIPDSKLRQFYQTAACVVVPLLESVQPAGQSVAMQAMMCGAPVVMTRTQGWWGSEILHEGEHITSVPPKDSTALAHAITQALRAKSTSNARLAMLKAGWTSQGFAERLEAACKIPCQSN